MQTGTKRAIGPTTIIAKKSILGAYVINRQAKDLGKIEDLVIDMSTDHVAYAILSFGGILGMGDKHFAIPWEALTFDLGRKVAILDVDEDRLKNAPGFDKDNWPDMADETWITTIYSYYGHEPVADEEPENIPPL